jgi:hypothetical protein
VKSNDGGGRHPMPLRHHFNSGVPLVAAAAVSPAARLPDRLIPQT